METLSSAATAVHGETTEVPKINAKIRKFENSAGAKEGKNGKARDTDQLNGSER